MFSQTSDIHFNRILRDILVVGKQPVGQLALGKDLAGRVDEQFKKTQLAIAHCNGFAPNGQVACNGVEHDTTNLDRRPGIAGFATQNSAATSIQFGMIEGFGDVVVGPQIKRTDSIRHLASRGKNDHRGVQIAGAMLLQEHAPIAIRQHDVQEDQIILTGFNEGRRIRQSLCMINDMAVLPHP